MGLCKLVFSFNLTELIQDVVSNIIICGNQDVVFNIIIIINIA
jgi:hypothetical protein